MQANKINPKIKDYKETKKQLGYDLWDQRYTEKYLGKTKQGKPVLAKRDGRCVVCREPYYKRQKIKEEDYLVRVLNGIETRVTKENANKLKGNLEIRKGKVKEIKGDKVVYIDAQQAAHPDCLVS